MFIREVVLSTHRLSDSGRDQLGCKPVEKLLFKMFAARTTGIIFPKNLYIVLSSF